MEEKKFDSTSFSEAIRKANEAFDGAAEVRWSEDVSELVFAWPKKKVAWIAVVKGIVLVLLIAGVVTEVLPFWLFVIVLFAVEQIYPLYKTFHRTVVDMKCKTVSGKWGFITIKECSLNDYDKMLVYCLSVNGSSPIPEDFCLVFKESGKRKELLVTHIGSKDAAKTSAIKEAVVSLFQLILRDCSIDGWEDETPEYRLIHRNSIHR
ncbi:MAG: hypothetical protein MJZ87_09210 [Bacteroidales bacterium]|nr:hypothetical protein [Bacteroidales bacterium]